MNLPKGKPIRTLPLYKSLLAQTLDSRSNKNPPALAGQRVVNLEQAGMPMSHHFAARSASSLALALAMTSSETLRGHGA